MIDNHCIQLHQCLCAAVYADGSPKAAAQDKHDAENMLSDAIQMALTGKLQEMGTGIACNDQLASIQVRYPSLWEACREVSTIAKERADLIEQVTALNKERAGWILQQRRLQEQSAAHQQDCATPASLEALRHADSEELLAQQRQAMGNLRQQLDETRRLAQEREGELGQLRLHLSELTRQRTVASSTPSPIA